MGFLSSTLVLSAEFLVVAAMGAVLYAGYYRGVLLKKLLLSALAVETFFNVGYMVARTAYPSLPGASPPAVRMLGMAHGIFSLAVFAAAIVFFFLAYGDFSKGANFFRKHRVASLVLCVSWAVALGSGTLLYFLTYF
jgi:hypothetical protein